MTRLRLTGENGIYWTKEFIAGTKVIRGYVSGITLEGFNYSILELEPQNEVTLLEKNCRSFEGARKNLKKELIQLGVLFADEVRKKIG